MAQQAVLRPYNFDVTNTEVVIQHRGHGDFIKYLRVNPNNTAELDRDGGRGKYARWIVEKHGEKIKIRSKLTGKYLRIKSNAVNNSERHIDVGGSGGKWTLFKIYRQFFNSSVIKLESAEQPGRYIGIAGKIRVGNGGKWTEVKFFKIGNQPTQQPHHHHHPAPQVIIQPKPVIVQQVQPQSGNFVHPYLFKQKNIVVIQHKGGSNGHMHTKYLRVHPQNHAVLDPNGGKGEFAHFEVDPSDNGRRIRLKSVKSGKYLRIANRGQVIDVTGGGGEFTVFNVLKQNDGTIKLQSRKFPAAYVAVGQNNTIHCGNGGMWTALKMFRSNDGHQTHVQQANVGGMFAASANFITNAAASAMKQGQHQHHGGHQHHHQQGGRNKTICPRCKGNGWCHNSTMNHDKPPNQKCFFCKSCDSCAGKGWIQGRIQMCPKCRGNGWSHDSSMKHDKSPNEKCFFCKVCSGCGGKGRI